jgi:phage virion morphogenesis protein
VIDAQVDISIGRRRLQALADLQFITDAMDGIAHDLSAKVAMGFRDQKDPWGQPWAPLKPSTIRARRKGKGGGSTKILRDTGVLSNSITAQRTGPLTIEMGTTVPYAAAHQFGASINFSPRSLRVRLRKFKNSNGKNVYRFAKDKHKKAITRWGSSQGWKVNIPARPFLPLIAGNVASLPASWVQIMQRRLDIAARRAGGQQ